MRGTAHMKTEGKGAKVLNTAILILTTMGTFQQQVEQALLRIARSNAGLKGARA